MRIFPKRKICYNWVKISLSDIIARLQRLLFSVLVVLLRLPPVLVSSTRTTLYFCNCLFNLIRHLHWAWHEHTKRSINKI